MKLFRLPAFAGLFLAALCCAPVQAQVFRCQGPAGMTFSDRPCPEEQKQETLKAAPAPGTVNVAVACAPGVLRAAGAPAYARIGACEQMRRCDSGDAGSCTVYCEKRADDFLPGVKFGPASPACVKYNGYARGANWVQVSRRHGQPGYPHEVMNVACVSKAGEVEQQVFVTCEKGTDRCSNEGVRRGNALSGAAPLDGLMKRLCGG